MPRAAAAKLKSRMLYEEALVGLPRGFANDAALYRTWKERCAKNGHEQASTEWEAAGIEQDEVARAILEIPSLDRIGDGIRAAASLALNEDCENAYTMADVLWEMAARAGFTRPDDPEFEQADDEAVQS
jgi:hypothetical protein